MKAPILIVQADIHLTQVLQEHFEKAGHRVVSTTDPAQVMNIIRQDPPQSLILDMETPGLDAAALTGNIRSTPRTRHIHVTLLTPRADRENRLSALLAGVDDYLNKPFDIEELGLRIRNALRRATFDSMINPVTGLPGPRLIEQELLGIMRSKEPWTLLRISLRGFGAFGDVYGFLAGEEALRFAAHMFGQIVDRLGTSNDFMGHSGGNSFMLITYSDQVDALKAEMASRFNEDVKSHYSFRERERGYMIYKGADGDEKQVPLMTLSIHSVRASDGPFYDIRELTQI